MYQLALFLLSSFCISNLDAQSYWKDVSESTVKSKTGDRWIVPDKFRSLELDYTSFTTILRTAPARDFVTSNTIIIYIPRPDGGFERFAIQEAPLMPGELADKFPDIRTFAGRGLHDELASIYVDFTHKGFHAMVRSPNGDYWIDPLIN